MTTAIVTDSTSDIPEYLREQLNIHVIPAILIIQGKSYLDGEGISREEFYTKLPGMNESPTTASPSIEAFKSIYNELFSKGFSEILSIHLPELLSGIVNTARIAAEEFGEQVKVIDSGQISMGLGFQVIEAARAASANLSMDYILDKVNSVRKNTRLFAMLDTLEYIHRSGRVSWAQAQIGSLLKIKPFLEVSEGSVINRGRVRTRRKGVNHLVEKLQELAPIDQLALLHTNAEYEAKKFLARLALPEIDNPIIVNVTTVIGNHVGPNGLGFVAILKN